MRRFPAVIAFLLIALPAAALGALVVADHRSADQLAPGSRVAGIEVGGLTTTEAIRRVDARLGTPARRPVRVALEGDQRTFVLTAARAEVRLDIRGAVARAYKQGREGSFLGRGWRELSGGSVSVDEAAKVTANAAAVRSFVGTIHRAVARKAVNAGLDVEVDHVAVQPSKPGRRLAGREDLVKHITAALAQPDGRRDFRTRVIEVRPEINEDNVFDSQPVAVTVSREAKRVRVFDRGKLVQTYSVAVGEPKYPTPVGRFTVQSMQKDPTWNVPDSDWAGDMAGKTIPGGDPRNPLVARWIGFNGSVGFHGTKSIDSLGRAASHGCVRMNPSDVKDLFERVHTGTPVLVAA